MCIHWRHNRRCDDRLPPTVQWSSSNVRSHQTVWIGHGTRWTVDRQSSRCIAQMSEVAPLKRHRTEVGETGQVRPATTLTRQSRVNRLRVALGVAKSNILVSLVLLPRSTARQPQSLRENIVAIGSALTLEGFDVAELRCHPSSKGLARANRPCTGRKLAHPVGRPVAGLHTR